MKYTSIYEKTQYDIKSRFNFFNKLMFNNEIDLNFKLLTNQNFPNSFMLGNTSIGKENKVIAISINTDNSLPSEVYDVILIHEMIHAYLQQKGVDFKENMHGKAFMDLYQSLRKKFPKYKIPIKEDLSGIDEILDDLGL